jgi:biofilm PGA synthesis N-glycosyltransferase PgaC
LKNSSQTVISIVIPAYNAERTIFRTLDSIYKSGFPKEQLEVILIDNNSTDETKLIAERFPISVIHEALKETTYSFSMRMSMLNPVILMKF